MAAGLLDQSACYGHAPANHLLFIPIFIFFNVLKREA